MGQPQNLLRTRNVLVKLFRRQNSNILLPLGNHAYNIYWTYIQELILEEKKNCFQIKILRFIVVFLANYKNLPQMERTTMF